MRYGWLIGFMLLAGVTWAADVPDEKKAPARPVFPWNQMYLRWQPNGPPDPTISTYILECGTRMGVYTVTSEYRPSVVAVLMKEILPEPGTWYCHVSAMAGSRVKSVSPEYAFDILADMSVEGFVQTPCP
jgi:hypothetical protein